MWSRSRFDSEVANANQYQLRSLGAEPRFLAHADQGLGQPLLREGQGLSHRDGRRLVVQTDDDDHRAATATAGTSVAQVNVKTTTAKPATAHRKPVAMARFRKPKPPRTLLQPIVSDLSRLGIRPFSPNETI